MIHYIVIIELIGLTFWLAISCNFLLYKEKTDALIMYLYEKFQLRYFLQILDIKLHRKKYHTKHLMEHRGVKFVIPHYWNSFINNLGYKNNKIMIEKYAFYTRLIKESGEYNNFCRKFQCLSHDEPSLSFQKIDKNFLFNMLSQAYHTVYYNIKGNVFGIAKDITFISYKTGHSYSKILHSNVKLVKEAIENRCKRFNKFDALFVK